MTTYRIIRFFRDEDRWVVVAVRRTLDEAQAHCRRDDTHGADWFDGYEVEQS